MSIQLKSRKKSEVIRRRLARFFFDEEIVLEKFLGGNTDKNKVFLTKIRNENKLIYIYSKEEGKFKYALGNFWIMVLMVLFFQWL